MPLRPHSLLLLFAAIAISTAHGASASDNSTASSGSRHGNGAVHAEIGSLEEQGLAPGHVEDLIQAISNRSNYAPSVPRPICVVEVQRVTAQVVDGINYHFEVDGCVVAFTDALGNCDPDSCMSPQLYALEMYADASKDVYEVQRIALVADEDGGSDGIHDSDSEDTVKEKSSEDEEGDDDDEDEDHEEHKKKGKQAKESEDSNRDSENKEDREDSNDSEDSEDNTDKDSAKEDSSGEADHKDKNATEEDSGDDDEGNQREEERSREADESEEKKADEGDDRRKDKDATADSSDSNE